jgi:N-acetylmuramoyl-L-alanine amidase/FlgD Ig-like domain
VKPLLALIAVAAAFVAPAVASAGLSTITYRDVPIHADRSLASTPGRFDLVGVRWHGSGSVQFSVRSTSGTWGPWLDAAAEEEDQPDAGSREAAPTRGWRVGNPTWVGAANGIRYHTTGSVRDLRASFVRSPELRIPLRAVSSAGAPPIVSRSAWGADESIRKAAPQYAPAIRFASVHHTAGPNSYSPAQAAAILRAIEVYHVKSNGWNDIGYNFLVDRYGTVYEGRYGGIDRNVIGAYARGFNTGSIGVAVIGTFSSAAIPAAAETSLEKLLAWRLDLAHVDPVSTLTFVSGGSERYRAGVPVVLRAVSGHRDTGLTTCPGDLLFVRLDTIAAKTQAIGLPKLYEPKVTGGLGGPVRFQARVSSALAWKVSVTDALGQQLALGTGRGPTVDYTWDASLVTTPGATWRIEVAGATPVSGTFGKAVVVTGPLAITGLTADPATISPNGDGQADSATVTYSTNATATVTVTLHDAAGVQLATLGTPGKLATGEHSFTFDGLGQPDGIYTIVVTAVDPLGVSVASQLTIAITRTLVGAALEPAVLTPNGDGNGDALTVTFELVAPATVRLRVLRDGKWVATPYTGALGAGPQSIGWNGAKRTGKTLDGAYTVAVDATDAIGTATVSLPFLLDAHPPVVKLAARPVRLWVSEAAIVTVRVNGSLRRLQAVGPGYLALTGIRKVRTIVVVARDPAGNRTVFRKP